MLLLAETLSTLDCTLAVVGCSHLTRRFNLDFGADPPCTVKRVREVPPRTVKSVREYPPIRFARTI